MKTLLSAGLAAALLGTAAPAAHAHPSYSYDGECRLTQGGDPDSGYHPWVTVAVVATHANSSVPAVVSIVVLCRVFYDTTSPGFAAVTVSGVTVAAGHGTWTSQEPTGPVIRLCTEVTVGGEYHEDCRTP